MHFLADTNIKQYWLCKREKEIDRFFVFLTDSHMVMTTHFQKK